MSLIAFDVEKDLETLPLVDINLNELAIIHKNGKLWKLPLVSLASLIATPARGHIDGLICSNDTDADHDVITGPGECRDSTNLYTLKLESAISKMYDQPFDIGTGAGGWDGTGALPTSGVFYEHLIQRDSDGLIDKLGSLSKTAPTMPTGFSIFREIRAQVTDAAANIIPTDQIGDVVRFKTAIESRAMAALANTNRNGFTVVAPPLMEAILNLRGDTTANADVYMWMRSESYVDAAASASNNSLWMDTTYSPNNIIDIIKTDATRQIFIRGSSTNIRMGLISLGWIDDRGRNAA